MRWMVTQLGHLGWVTLLLVCGVSFASAQQPAAFVGINVVPMDSERIIPAQTVLVEGGRIVSITAAGTANLPDGTRIIQGSGKYLLPGLADLHVHLMRDSTELLLYLANGVTTVRDLAGEPMYLRWRDQIAAGERAGPRLYVASPLINAPGGRRVVAWFWGGTLTITAAACLCAWLLARGISRQRARWAVALLSAVGGFAMGCILMRTVVPFPDALVSGSDNNVAHEWIGSTGEAARAVRQAAQKYDLIKLYGGLSRAQFDAAIRAARSARVHTVAHVPPRLGLTHALHSGLNELAHIYFIVQDLQVNSDTTATDTADRRQAAYNERLRYLVEELKRTGVQVTSTLMPMPEIQQRLTDSVAFFTRDDFKYRPPATRQRILAEIRKGASQATIADVQAHVTWGSATAFELTRAGVPLALGTDASPLDVVAGFAAHAELDMFIASGMTPYEALRTATVNASRVADASDQWGTISVGKRADLLVVDGNPLEAVTALRRPAGVMMAGRWYDRAELDNMLGTVVRRRAGS